MQWLRESDKANTNRVLSEVIQTGTDRGSAHTATVQLSHNTLYCHHPARQHTADTAG